MLLSPSSHFPLSPPPPLPPPPSLHPSIYLAFLYINRNIRGGTQHNKKMLYWVLQFSARISETLDISKIMIDSAYLDELDKHPDQSIQI